MKILISYSRSDRSLLDSFLPLLSRVYGKNSIWFDGDIPGGSNWWQTILDEIKQCDLVIFLVSNESLASPYCQAEIREAMRLHKPVLPIIVQPLDPPYPGQTVADLKAFLIQTQYVDLISIHEPENITQLYAAINHLYQPDKNIIDAQSFHKKQFIRWASVTEGQGVVIAAVIGLIGVIIAAIISTSGNNPIPTSSPQIPSRTAVEATNTNSFVQQATATPSLPSNTPVHVFPEPSLEIPTLTAQSTDEFTSRNIELLMEENSLTLYVSEQTAISEMGFGVQIENQLHVFYLEDGFSVLSFTDGIVDSGACFVYALANTQPVLSQKCTEQTYRYSVSPVDRFWYDSLQNRYKDIVIYRGNTQTGAICPAGQFTCPFQW